MNEKKRDFILNFIISSLKEKNHPATQDQKETIKEVVETLLALGL